MMMKDAIIKYVENAKDWISFAELSQRIEGFKSDEEETAALFYPGHDNLLIWPNMSAAAVEAITELLAENKIRLQHGSPLSYLIDGATVKLPIAKSLRNYRTMHWLPMFIRPVYNKAMRRQYA
jgi:hypothetical protein